MTDTISATRPRVPRPISADDTKLSEGSSPASTPTGPRLPASNTAASSAKTLMDSDTGFESSRNVPDISTAASRESATPGPDSSENGSHAAKTERRPLAQCPAVVGASDPALDVTTAVVAAAKPKAPAAAAATVPKCSLMPIDAFVEDLPHPSGGKAPAPAAPVATVPAPSATTASPPRRESAPRLHPPASIDAGLDDLALVCLGGKGRGTASPHPAAPGGLPHGATSSGSRARSMASASGTAISAPPFYPAAAAAASTTGFVAPVPKSVAAAMGKGLPVPVSAGGIPSGNRHSGRASSAWVPPSSPPSALGGSVAAPYYGSGSDVAAADTAMELPPTPPGSSSSFRFSTLDPTATPWSPPWLESTAGAAAITAVAPVALGGGGVGSSSISSTGHSSRQPSPSFGGGKAPLLRPGDGSHGYSTPVVSPAAAGVSTSLPSSATRGTRFLGRTVGSSSGVPITAQSADDVSGLRAPASVTLCHRHNPYTGSVDYLENHSSPGVGLSGSLSSMRSDPASMLGSATMRARVAPNSPQSPLRMGSYDSGVSGSTGPATRSPPNVFHYRDPLQRLAERRRLLSKQASPLLMAGESGSATAEASTPSSSAASAAGADGDAAGKATGAAEGAGGSSSTERPATYLEAIRRATPASNDKK